MPIAIKDTKFDNLLEQIPKYPELWNSDDVATWLALIGMESYARNFEDMSIDGLLILELTEEDLESELRISIKLHRKKIVKAIEMLRQYDSYLRHLADEQCADMLKKQSFEDEDMIKEEMMTADHNMGARPPKRSNTHPIALEAENIPVEHEAVTSDRCLLYTSPSPRDS